jgi:diguanylate cyclase (GGDEF)-like protein
LGVRGIVAGITVKLASVAIALSVQILSVILSVLSGVTSMPFAVLSIITIVVLLRGLRGVPKRIPSIEELIEVKVSERTNVLVAQMSEYEQQASTDAMTGLLNRRGGEAAITSQVSRSKDSTSPLSFLLIDIDHFKKVNDSYGHTIGDEVITAVANCLKKNIRASDVAVRWGGEEYLVVLQDTDICGAVTTAEKLREQVALLEVQKTTISISVGCAELGDDDFQVAVARADMNLYFAKSKGRNRVFPDFDKNVLDR